MDTNSYSCIKILITFSLPFFLLASCSCAAVSTTFLRPPSSADLAADVLRARGYSIFASFLSTTTNFSGTLFAPPDFAFLNNRRFPPRPSVSLLLYHTLKPPLILTWPKLSSYKDGDELRTLYYDHCLFLFNNSYSEELSISSSPLKNPISISAVKIRQPDLYVDDNLTVHGIDDVLDPTSATKCFTVDITPRQVNGSFLDHAMRALRRKGFSVVATAMAIRRSDLLSLRSVTIFAVSDKNLFRNPIGFRFDFRHHVVPVRYRLSALKRLTMGGMELDTLVTNKTIIVDSIDGDVSVDGVAVDLTEVYHNRWIVVVSIMNSLDEYIVSEAKPPITAAITDFDYSAPSPAPFAGNSNLTGVSSPSPENFHGDFNSIGSLSPAAENFGGGSTDSNSIRTPSPAAEIDGDDPGNSSNDFVKSNSSPSPSLEHCDLSGLVSLGVEGGDLLCPVSKARELGESDVHVEETASFHADGQATEELTQSDEFKIADDLFFYT